MGTITVALLQMASYRDNLDANQAKGEEYCRRAREMGADIALFPEMWSVGYTPGQHWEDNGDLWRAPELWKKDASAAGSGQTWPPDLWQGQAIGRDHAFVTHFRELARELEMAIALTYLEEWPGAPRNSVSLIDRHGEIVLTYAKVHLCEWAPDEATLTPGEDFYVCTLDTAQGPVQIGAMICYDREFPESARILMLKGAEIILTPNGCDLDVPRLAQFRARAYENMVGVAMANYAAPQNNGNSIAFDAVTFDEQGRTLETKLVEADDREGIYLARFDLDRMRDYRTRETWGNAFRKPHRYALLTSLEVREPFVRVSAAGKQFDRTAR